MKRFTDSHTLESHKTLKLKLYNKYKGDTGLKENKNNIYTYIIK